MEELRCSYKKARLESEATTLQDKANEEILKFAMIETKEALDKLDEIMSTPGVDGIYIGPADLSLAIGEKPSFDNPEGSPQYKKILEILDHAKKNNAKILQASTSEVYGDPEIHPQKENYNGNVNTLGFRSCYDEGKRCAETLFMDYKREHNLNIKIVRIFNTYGPNMTKNDGRVVSNFILQALNNEPITIYGDGSQTRSFQYLSLIHI